MKTCQLIVLLVFAAFLGGCQTARDLPPVDLDSPGWTTWTGQASWRPDGDSPTLAGDILAGQNENGDVFVNFSTAALPIFSARSMANEWQIEFVERGRSYSGRGGPPKRFAWFSLPGLLATRGTELSGWDIDWRAIDDLALNNERTGERLHVVLDP